MEWDVEYTDEFFAWFGDLSEAEQDRVMATVNLLVEYGPDLGYPHSSGIHGSRYDHLRELRVQIQRRPFRVLYAFDPRRVAILLCGGDKTGDDRWYETAVRQADTLYGEHLKTLQREGLL